MSKQPSLTETLSKIDTITAYNDGYTHEALHTTHVLMSTFDDFVLNTRCADEFPDVKAAADGVHKAMFNLYQLIGAKFKDDEPSRPTDDGEVG